MIKNDFDNVFKSVDILMTPTSPNTAFKFGSKGAQNPVELYLEDLFTISSNLAGLPAISIPHGQVNSPPVYDLSGKKCHGMSRKRILYSL